MADFSWTYTTLKAALQAWEADTDTDFVTEIDTIIGKAEVRLIRDLSLSIFNVLLTGSLTANNRFLTKPAGYLLTKQLYITDSNGETKHLYKRTPQWCTAYWPVVTNTEEPNFFNEYSETQIEIMGTPDSNYAYGWRITQRPAGLSDTTASTWLGDNVPDALKAACQYEANIYFKQDPSDAGRLASFERDYNRAVASARDEFRDLIQHEHDPIQPGPAA